MGFSDWRYQDTFLQRSTAHRRDLIEAEQRRAVDHVFSILEKQGLASESTQIRRTPDFKSVQAAIAALMESTKIIGVANDGSDRVSDERPKASSVLERHADGLEVWHKDLEVKENTWAKAYPGYGVFSMVFLPENTIDKVLDYSAMKILIAQSQVEGQGLKVPSSTSTDQFTEIQNRRNAVEGTYDLEGYQEL